MNPDKVQQRIRELQNDFIYMLQVDNEITQFKSKRDYIRAIPEIVDQEMREKQRLRKRTPLELMRWILNEEKRK